MQINDMERDSEMDDKSMSYDEMDNGKQRSRKTENGYWNRKGGWAATDRLATQWFLSRIGHLNFAVYVIICSFSPKPEKRMARLRVLKDPNDPNYPSIMGSMPIGTTENTVRLALRCLREYGLISTRKSGNRGQMIISITKTAEAKKALLAREARDEAIGLLVEDCFADENADEPYSTGYDCKTNHIPLDMIGGPNHIPQDMIALPSNREGNREEENREGASQLLTPISLPDIGSVAAAAKARTSKAPTFTAARAPEKTPAGKVKTLKQSPDNYPVQFKLLREAYPKKANLQDEIRAWECVALSEELADMLVARAKIYRTYSDAHVAFGFVPHLTTWLNQGRYDNPESTMVGA